MAITFGASGLPSYITDVLNSRNKNQNALNIRATGATAGESNRFANLAPTGTKTKTPALTPQDTLDLFTGRPTVPANSQGPLRGGYVTASQAVNTASNALANKVAAGAKPTATTATGQVVSVPDLSGTAGVPGTSAGAGGAGGTGGTGGGAGDGGGGGGGGAAVEEAPVETAPVEPDVDVQALYDSILAGLLEADWLGFQGDQAAELRRLQNLRNQLFGDAEYGTTGSVQRQRDLDARARRRLAAQRAVSGMLQGGAYAGTQRGVGTLQQAEQEYALQEMLRPFREQTASDRLLEFGLGYAPDSRVFNLLDFGMPDDIMGGWAASTWAGREAQARARQAALQQLAQRGLSLD